MIELTVKTLDSQNHSFSVEDDITVADFKQKIAETINIPADTQRIIYCGRVLKDDVKLSEYDVNGKVVHLVQRAPPPSSQGPNRPATPPAQPQTQRRNIREFEHGMYLGSMAFPSNLMETQGIVPPPPTHSLAASRLNVAKRMLRRAEALLTALENPTSRTAEQTPPEEPQEEVTPVFEARVIVPNNSLNEPIDEVLSAVQNSLLNATAVVNGGRPIVLSDANIEASGSDVPASASTEGTSGSQQINIDSESPTMQSASSTPEGASPASTSTENLATDQRNGATAEGSTGNTLAENASRTTEMADLLDTLGRLQVRFAPFLEQYQNFMRQDPTISSNDARKTQAMINRVSEILHFLGHAYHSLSDIIVRVRTAAPRPLLCRPILIQHSAVVQTGFPIQVEAQINFSPDNAGTSATSTTQQTATTTTATNSATPPTTNVTTASGTAPTGPTITAHIQPQMLGLMPGAAVHVQSFPIEIRGIHRPVNQSGGQRPSSQTPEGIANEVMNLITMNATNASAAPTTSSSTGDTNTPTTNASASGSQFNPNVEFFMEVTPESITIDSLETTLLAGASEADILRGAMNAPPPEFLESIMQMAGHIINRSGQMPSTPPSTSPSSSSAAPATTTTDCSTQSTQTTANANQSATPGQNSQARGNTQTNPTTSTHTRSTARPHVHLAQHAMQGFDPFLPCNSHHVTPRRRVQARSVSQQGNQNNNGRQDAPQQGNTANVNANQLNPIYNIVQGIVNSFRNVYRQRNTGQAAGQSSTTPTADNAAATEATAASAQAAPPPSEPAPPPLLPLSTFLNMNLSDLGNNSQGSTISQILQGFPDINYVEGESIFLDLIMLLLRNLTIRDLIQLNSSRLDPLLRIRNELRNFFLRKVLDGTNTVASVDAGVNRLLVEMETFWNNFEHLEVRDDIDIVRSIQMLFRTRLPNIVSLAASHNPNSLRMLVEQCRITLRQLCALVLRASADGQRGVEQVVEVYMVERYLGTPRGTEALRTYFMSRAYFRRFLSNLSVPESILQPYIVRRVDSAMPTVVNDTVELSDNKPVGEPMELDEQEASGSSNDLAAHTINLQDDSESIPTVDIGSEPWHNQVPTDWVPIIVRDTHRQRRQNPQPAFSDAYLSGMPSKRRKIVTNTKPQGTLPQVIQESVRHSVTTSGLTSVAPIDTVTEAAGADISIQSAYRELLRTSVQSNLQDNEDFTPERFPNASDYFNKPQ